MKLERIEAHDSVSQHVAMAVVSAVFIAMGVAVVCFGSHASKAMLTLCFIFFGACLGVALRSVFDRTPKLTLDEHGVFQRGLGVGLIPWTEIVDVRMERVVSQTFVVLKLRNYERWVAQLPPGWRRAMWQLDTSGEVSVRVSNLDVTDVELLDFIARKVVPRFGRDAAD